MENTVTHFQRIYASYSNQEIILKYYQEVGNPGWSSSRGIFLKVLIQEFQNRNIDVSQMYDGTTLRINQEISL